MKRKSYRISIFVLSSYVASWLAGCSRVALFDPAGPIGREERFIILTAFGLMLIVVVPVIVMALWFARRYRAYNRKAAFTPDWCRSAKIESAMWLVPAVIVAALGVMTWIGTHRLDPYKAIDPGVEPIRIEAVALDWKWLFIYPDHGVAAVNQLVFPAGVPLRFRITSATVLAGFFIPRLGSQIYAMPGAQTKLNLKADEPGTYYGHNQQFSGRGYSEMNFRAIAATAEQFETWVRQSKEMPDVLDSARYEELAKPSSDDPVMHFSAIEPGLFENILAKHRGAPEPSTGTPGRETDSTAKNRAAAEGH